MRRGRTVEIQMSSATACTGVWQFCLSWVCRQTVPHSCGHSCKGPVSEAAGGSVDSQSPRVSRTHAVALLERRWPAGNHRQGIPRHDRTRTGERASLSWTPRAAGPSTRPAWFTCM